MKFEAIWQDRSQWKYLARLNDGKPTKVAEVPSQFEYYVQHNTGTYKYILDQNISLLKRLGTFKDAKDQYGVVNPIYRYIRDNYWGKGYNLSPRIWHLDIETRADGSFPKPELAEKQITLIQIFDNKLETMIIFGLRDFEMENGYELPYKVKYIKCMDEIDLLSKYLAVFKKLDPLIIHAWNGLGFDYPYIHNRLKNLGMDPNLMSNYGKVEYSANTDNKTQKLMFNFSAHGHYYIDMLDAYKKFTPGIKSSYALDFISKIELGEGKVNHNEFTTFDSFYTGDSYQISNTPYDDKVREEIRQLKIKERNNENYDKDRLLKLLQFQFVYYGIKDVHLLKRLDDKINLTNIMSGMAQKMGCTIDDTMGTIKPWSAYISNVCYTMNLAFPPKQDYEKNMLKGGFVREPIMGRHKWVLSFDFNSMYPMNMVGFNMSPETYVPLAKCPSDLRDLIMKYFNSQDEDKALDVSQDVWNKVTPLLQKYNYSMGINGALFDKSKEGIIPNLVWDIYTQRKKDKKTMLKYEKQKEIIQKIILARKNS